MRDIHVIRHASWVADPGSIIYAEFEMPAQMTAFVPPPEWNWDDAVPHVTDGTIWRYWHAPAGSSVPNPMCCIMIKSTGCMIEGRLEPFPWIRGLVKVTLQPPPDWMVESFGSVAKALVHMQLYSDTVALVCKSGHACHVLAACPHRDCWSLFDMYSDIMYLLTAFLSCEAYDATTDTVILPARQAMRDLKNRVANLGHDRNLSLL